MNISAYIRPAFKIKALDHTYVTSSEGDAWGCHGAKGGGKIIVEGDCNLNQSRCIAGKNDMAGIRYMRTGVCHQIANRILHPANIRIDANGTTSSIMGTYAVYGIYGNFSNTPDWPELRACVSPNS